MSYEYGGQPCPHLPHWRDCSNCNPPAERSPFDRLFGAWLRVAVTTNDACTSEAFLETSDGMIDECAQVARSRADTPFYEQDRPYLLALRAFSNACELELVRRGCAWLHERGMATS